MLKKITIWVYLHFNSQKEVKKRKMGESRDIVYISLKAYSIYPL